MPASAGVGNHFPQFQQVCITRVNGAVGRATHPGWYRNLKADPKVHIQIRDEHLDLIARDADDAERNLYWPKLIRLYPPYRGYRKAD